MQSAYGALTGNTVKRFSLTGNFDWVDVVNVDNAGNAPIYFTFSAVPLASDAEAPIDPPDPTVAGNNTWVTPGAVGQAKRVRVYGKNVVVKVISAGASNCGVIGGNRGEEV